MSLKSYSIIAATVFGMVAGSAHAIPLRVDFQDLPMQESVSGGGLYGLTGGFTFDTELETVSDVSIGSLGVTFASYTTGIVVDRNGRFGIDFTAETVGGMPSLFPRTLRWTFLEPAIGFDTKIAQIAAGTSNDPFLRADLVETNGFLRIGSGNGVAVLPTVVVTEPVPPSTVPLPAGLPLLAAALAVLGLRRKAA